MKDVAELTCRVDLPNPFPSCYVLELKHLTWLRVWCPNCSSYWYGLREDESVDGSEPRGISGATQSGSQSGSQARIYAGLEVSGCVSERTDGRLGEVAVMKTPTICQWYQILRRHQLTVFQAVRGALWLARTSPHSKRLCVIDAANQPLIESAQHQMRVRTRA